MFIHRLFAMASTHRVETLFAEKLAYLRRLQNEITHFEQALSSIGRKVLRGSYRGNLFYTYELEMFGENLYDPKLDNFKGGVVPLLEQAIRQDLWYNVWQDMPIHSALGLVELWSVAHTTSFREKAILWWNTIECAVSPDRPLCNMFCVPEIAPKHFTDAFPFTEIPTDPQPMADDQGLEHNPNSDFERYDDPEQQRWSGYPSRQYIFDNEELNGIVTGLSVRRRRAWDIAENLRAKKVRIFIEFLQGMPGNATALTREQRDDRNYELHVLLEADLAEQGWRGVSDGLGWVDPLHGPAAQQRGGL